MTISSRPVRAKASLQPAGTGREELRAAMLRPYLLRLRDERGESAVRALLSTVGVPPLLLEDDAAWLSLAAAQRTLAALATALGESALETRGAWMTHPETLGAYVRMLRVASAPEDAYRYLAAHAGEATRVGSYELVQLERGKAEIVYKPKSDLEDEQSDPRLCAARRAEFASVPRIWGLQDASVEHPTCLAHGGKECRYVLRWETFKRRKMLAGILLGGISSGVAVAPAEA